MNTTDTELVSNLETILSDIYKELERDRKGILLGKELHDFESEVIERTTKALLCLDEDEQRMFSKIKSTWRNMPKPGFLPAGEGKKTLQKYVDFIEDKLAELTGKRPISDVFIPAGKTFTGRKQLRNIFATATTEIFIIDNYLSSDILDILNGQIEETPNLSLRFLIDADKKNNKRKVQAFIVDLGALKNEYPRLKVECREQTKMLHDRFAIIDSIEVYHSGTSFDGLGKTGGRISKVTDQESASKHLNELSVLWDTATPVIIS